MSDAIKAYVYGLNAFLNRLYSDDKDFSRLGEIKFLDIPKVKYLFTHIREEKGEPEFCLRKAGNLKFYDIARFYIHLSGGKIQIDTIEIRDDKDTEKMKELKERLEESIYKPIISFG